MNSLSRAYFRRRGFLSALFSTSLAITLLSSSAFAWQQGTGSGVGTGSAVAPARKAAATLTANERKAAGRVKLETIREVTTTLSSPEFEGRGTGQPGADKAARWPIDRSPNWDSSPRVRMALTCKRSNSSLRRCCRKRPSRWATLLSGTARTTSSCRLTIRSRWMYLAARSSPATALFHPS